MPIWVSVCFLQLKYSSATLLGQFKPSRLAECIWTIWSQNISLIMIENQGTHSWNNIENGTHEQWQKKTAKPHWLVIGIRRLSQSMGSSYEKILKHAGKTGWHLARAVSVKPNAHTCGSTQSKSLKQCLVTFSDTPFDADPQRPTVSHRFCHHPNDHCRRMTSPPLLSWPSAPAHRRRACRPSPCLTLASSNGGMVQ